MTYTEELTSLYQSVDTGPHIEVWVWGGTGVESRYDPVAAMGKRLDYVETFLRVHTGVNFGFGPLVAAARFWSSQNLFFDENRSTLFLYFADMFSTANTSSSSQP